jgi:3-hydroxymyristoyl/3-hydroxydecanoyl-(acyl carrier protein) dehydratase
VGPGQEVLLRVEAVRRMGQIFLCRGVATAAGEVVAEAEITLRLA